MIRRRQQQSQGGGDSHDEEDGDGDIAMTTEHSLSWIVSLKEAGASIITTGGNGGCGCRGFLVKACSCGATPRHNMSSIRRWRLACMLLLLGCCVYGLVRGYYELELRITDPFWEAMLYMPLSYLRVKYLQRGAAATLDVGGASKQPQPQPRRFVMTYNHTFVVSLPSDAHRLATFQRINPGLSFQLHPATHLTHPQIHQHQQIQQWMNRFPSVRHLVSQGHYGTAGVSISHLRLLEALIQSTNDYMFVFEDDARLERDFLRHGEVMAPADADLVFLMNSDMKTVHVPWETKTKHHLKSTSWHTRTNANNSNSTTIASQSSSPPADDMNLIMQQRP
eukprot:scaffold546872_cov63-Attheya_sp.AAC.1